MTLNGGIVINVSGRVERGLGLAASHIDTAADELEIMLGERPLSGSLNVVLDKPLALDPAAALRFDGDRLLWPALLNGKPVWFYRWKDAPLHVAEFLSTSHLRTDLGLEEGDVVNVEVKDSLVGPTPALAWKILWKGREHWTRNRRYDWLARRMGVRFGFAIRPLNLKGVATGLWRLIRRTPPDYVFRRAEAQTDLQKVLNLLNYTKTSGSSYSARHFPAGYHSIDLQGHKLRGQRDPNGRLSLVPFDFAGKSALDLGSNQGGMLLALSDELRWGVGIDFDARMVNAATRICRAKNVAQLDYYVFDLERENLHLISDFLPESRVDICFLLSVCMWLKNWREVIDFAASISDIILFESNGSDVQQDEQMAYLSSVCSDVEILANESADDPGQKRRKLALARTRA